MSQSEPPTGPALGRPGTGWDEVEEDPWPWARRDTGGRAAAPGALPTRAATNGHRDGRLAGATSEPIGGGPSAVEPRRDRPSGDGQRGETTQAEGAAGDGTVPPGVPQHSNQKVVPRAGRASRRRRLLSSLLVLLAAVVCGGTAGALYVDHEANPSGGPGADVTVRIPAGASTTRIASLLAGARVIRAPDLFALYIKLEGAGPLMPGRYRLATNESYSAVVSQLENGPVPVVRKLVVPEGFTVRQIAAAVGRLHGIGISAAAFMAAADSGQFGSPYAPAGSKNLEGLLFPATYPVHQGESAVTLIEYMRSTFDDYASQLGLAAAAQRLGYTPYQVIKVASIVEREAKFDQDRGPIASVIYNRLALAMPIGAESTLLYGLGEPTGQVSITTPNRYNTLVNKGLPPTPIANPGIPSLEAAMNPPHTPDLYWVEVNPDGKMGFASTEAGFKHLQQECRAVKLC